MDKITISVFLAVAVFLLFLCCLCLVDRYEKRLPPDKSAKYSGVVFAVELFIISISLYINLYFSVYSRFGDSEYFAGVMKRLTSEGFFGLYSGGGISYPPFFHFLYGGMAWAMKWMGIAFDSTSRLFIFCVKLPCIVCEFLTAWLLLRMAEKFARKGQCAIILFMCLLNPGILLTTGYICQVDLLYVFCMTLSLYLLMNQKLKTAYFVFAAAVLFKFQAVFMTPVIAFAVVDEVFLKDFSWKRFFQHLGAGLSAIGMMLLSYVPFVYNFSSGEIAKGGFFSNFSNTTAGYGAASQNACNFWMLLGFNLEWQGKFWGPFSCQMWGRLFVVALVALSIVFYWKRRKDPTIYPMLAALLVYGAFCFEVRMMARYLYPAIFLVYLGYACRPNQKRFLCAAALSVAYILVIGVDYVIYPWVAYEKDLLLPRVVSLYTLICFGYLAYVIWSEGRDLKSA